MKMPRQSISIGDTFALSVRFLSETQNKWWLKMVKLREIKQYGNSKAIKLEPSDLIDLGLKVGDNVDISDLVFYSPQEIENKAKINAENIMHTFRKIQNQMGDELLSKFCEAYQ